MFSFFSKERKEAARKLREAYENHGFYSDEYIEAFIASKKRLTSDDHFTLCDIYTELQRFDEAQKELLSCKSGTFLDDITTGQIALCKIALAMGTGDYNEAIEAYEDRSRFLDIHFKNPARSRAAGDYYMYAATINAILQRKVGYGEAYDIYKEEIKKYYARLREWCDVFPGHRIQFDLTQTMVQFAKGEMKEAEKAYDECKSNILNHDFKYEWEREYFLNRLDRAHILSETDEPFDPYPDLRDIIEKKSEADL